MSSLTFSLALDQLADSVVALNEANALAKQKLKERNDLIMDAYEAGVPYRKLMKITGLSRNTLFNIINKPTEEVSRRDV